MKLVRYSKNGQPPRLGTLLGADRVMDLESSATAYLASRGVVRAGAIAAALFPHGSTRAFLEGGSASQDVLAAMTDAAKGGKYEPVSHPLGTARLHAPIADPGKFICIGLNYKDHAAETNNPAPKEPPIFPKWSNAIADPGEPVLRPRGEKTFDWEVELGVVIGRTARRTSGSAPLVLELDLLRHRRHLLCRQEPGSTTSFVEEGGRLAVGRSEGREHERPGDEGPRATGDHLAGQVDDV